MTDFPRDPALDSTPAFLREGYLFVSNRCERLGTDAFRARLMLREVVCMRGRDAAELFYGDERFTRRHAMPATTVSLLQGAESVQALDGEAHAHRKRMFVDLMTPAALDRIAEAFRTSWHEHAAGWRGSVVLHDEVRLVLTATALAWTGIEADEEGTRVLANQLSAMIDEAASFGPHYVHARYLRERCEAWARNVVREVRDGAAGPEGSPVRAIATHRDLSGEPLDADVAAVELINLLRPIAAVARYVTFAALELHRHPHWRERLCTGESGEVRARDIHDFVQEVRRTAPFFPVVAGLAQGPFEWRGHRFEEGDWVMLDLYGTSRDASVWEEPDAFRPERFEGRAIGPYDMVPQGGGDLVTAHRCPGEWITIRLMEEAVRLLCASDYDVPEQDLRVDLSRMPALPADGFVIALR